MIKRRTSNCSKKAGSIGSTGWTSIQIWTNNRKSDAQTEQLSGENEEGKDLKNY